MKKLFKELNVLFWFLVALGVVILFSHFMTEFAYNLFGVTDRGSFNRQIFEFIVVAYGGYCLWLHEKNIKDLKAEIARKDRDLKFAIEKLLDQDVKYAKKNIDLINKKTEKLNKLDEMSYWITSMKGDIKSLKDKVFTKSEKNNKPPSC